MYRPSAVSNPISESPDDNSHRSLVTSSLLQDTAACSDPMQNQDSADEPLTGSKHKAKPSRMLKTQRMSLIWASVVLGTLLVNTSVLGWALSRYGTKNAIVTLYRGDCEHSKRLNTWIHLLINILGSIMLAGSNYCMQCVIAPTRKEIDKAHAKKQWLDIGVPSFGNLPHIEKKRVALWFMLAISSLPLHFLFNSAFFVSLSTYSYNIIVATPQFVTGAPFSRDFLPYDGYSWACMDTQCPPWSVWQPLWRSGGSVPEYLSRAYPDYHPEPFDPSLVQNNISGYEELSLSDCIGNYAVDLITDRKTLVLISSDATVNGSSIIYGANYEYTPKYDLGLNVRYDPFGWICSGPNLVQHAGDNLSPRDACYRYLSEILQDSASWSPFGYHIDKCYSEPAPQQCAFSLSITIIAIVIACNVVKLICMLWIGLDSFGVPLMTLGDAIQSFLVEPDSETETLNLAGEKDVKSNWTPEGKVSVGVCTGPLTYRKSITSQQWWGLITAFVIALVTVALLLGFSIWSLPSNTSVMSLGFGETNVRSLISSWSIDDLNGTSQTSLAIISSALIANLPQVILAWIYFAVNSVCTSIAIAREWTHFGHSAKSLRVTSRLRGQQRNSYFLSLPYCISAPLVTLSTLLHWLISQSIFLAVISSYDENGTLKDPIATATCGFSPIPIMCVLAIGSISFLLIMILSRQKLDNTMPLVRSCSAAISAVCHPVRGTNLHSSRADPTLPIQWKKIEGLMGESGGRDHQLVNPEMSKAEGA